MAGVAKLTIIKQRSGPRTFRLACRHHWVEANHIPGQDVPWTDRVGEMFVAGLLTRHHQDAHCQCGDVVATRYGWVDVPTMIAHNEALARTLAVEGVGRGQ